MHNIAHRDKRKSINKRCLSAEDYSLLSSALRPRLLVIFTLFFGAFTIFNVFSDKNTFAASLELTVPTNFNIDLDPGTGTTFGESSNQQISIKTSGSFGYTLNIKPNDDTNLKNGENTIKTIAKSEGYDNSDGYKNSNEVNTWAYKPGKLNSVANTKYLPFPSVETLLDKTDKNNDTANTYDLTIAAKVDNTLSPGTYKNNFIVSATVNTATYNITYYLNNGINGPKSSQTGDTIENIIKLDSAKPTRADYEFLGWCSVKTSNEVCSGKIYQPGADYTLSHGDNNFTLWAIWKIIPMQDWNDCNSLTKDNGDNGESVYITLTDIRDNNDYKVAKLKDGKCWMVENLRITGMSIDSSNSDMSSGSFSIPNSANEFAGANTNTNAAYYYPTTNAGYYTWFTATAGTSPSSLSNMQNATKSICPKGWRLPTGGTGGEFEQLMKSYGNSSDQDTRNALTRTPVPGFFASEYWRNDGTFNTRNEFGFWISSTAGDSGSAYNMYISNTGVNATRQYADTYSGLSIRCVVRDI